MAIVKIYWRKNAKSLVEYVEKEGGRCTDPVTAHDCSIDNVAEDFAITAKSWNKDGKYQAIHVIQSWSEKESKMLPAEKFHEMGKALTETYFKGHEFFIKTHTDTDKTHNHIVINVVNYESGKMIENKKHHLYRLRDLSDKLCLENGLSIVNKEAKDRHDRMPDKVLRMERFNRQSYLLDTKQKADFARNYAQNYEEYAAFLGAFNIKVQIENKNITYFYPGRERGKRGAKLGKLYDKAGIEEAFKANEKRFKEHPELLASLGGELKTLKSESGVKVTSKKTAIIPIEELRRAKSENILEYCKKNKIALSRNDKGETVLKSRPYVVVNEREWLNTKNKTRGSLIELVANHKKMTFLAAVAHINNNPNLLLLEKHYGEVARKYTSFYIAKKDSLGWDEANKKLGDFFKAFDCDPKAATSLLKNQLAQVGKNGVIRLFPMGEETGALEFTQDESGKYKQKRLGAIRKPFIAVKGTSHQVQVFGNPIEALKALGIALFSNKTRKEGTLVLLEADTKAVDSFLAGHKHVNQLSLFSVSNQLKSAELDFFNNLRSRYNNLGFNISHDGLSRDSLSRSPDLSL